MAPRPPKKPKRKRRQEGDKKATRAHPASAYPPPNEGETRAAYAALCKYLDAGPDRSLRAVFPGNGNAHRWSVAHRWVERAADFDDERRDERLAALAARQRETDLATAEADARLSALAAAALFSDNEPTTQGMGLIRDLWRVGRNGADSARVSAVQALARLAGIDDLRRLRHHHATNPKPAAPTPTGADQAAVVDALAQHATTEQLAHLGADLIDDPPAPEPADGQG